MQGSAVLRFVFRKIGWPTQELWVSAIHGGQEWKLASQVNALCCVSLPNAAPRNGIIEIIDATDAATARPRKRKHGMELRE